MLQFWSFGAFFSDLQPVNPENPQPAFQEDPARRSLLIPQTDQVVEALFLDGRELRYTTAETTHEVLAKWITTSENP